MKASVGIPVLTAFLGLASAFPTSTNEFSVQSAYSNNTIMYKFSEQRQTRTTKEEEPDTLIAQDDAPVGDTSFIELLQGSVSRRPIEEFDQLWWRFSVMECWDKNQRHDYKPAWDCYLEREGSPSYTVTMAISESKGWNDPFDIWDAANLEARSHLNDPNVFPGCFLYAKDTGFLGTAWAKRGWCIQPDKQN